MGNGVSTVDACDPIEVDAFMREYSSILSISPQFPFPGGLYTTFITYANKF